MKAYEVQLGRHVRIEEDSNIERSFYSNNNHTDNRSELRLGS